MFQSIDIASHHSLEQGKAKVRLEGSFILPLALTRVDSGATWSQVQVKDVMGGKLSGSLQCLYLDEILLRSHHPNVVFENIYQILDDTCYFAFKIITAENIKDRLSAQLPRYLLLIYYPFHFFLRRVLPKLKGFRKACRMLHLPIDISKSEIMGRLIYKGFQIVSIEESEKETIFITKKHPTNNPSLSKPESSEGFMFKMNRMGKNAEHITVYKFRSMHPYAEYVQEYIHSHHGLDKNGKFKNDFRVSTGGRVIRKYWIDELPMLYNWVKGDLKLIGVRPLSNQYFNLYPEELRVIRIKHKPGLLPPFYADLPQSFNEIVQSELTYLKAYERAPRQTDLKYFVLILKNIFIHKARSG